MAKSTLETLADPLKDDPFMTLSEFAERIGKHRQTISRWAQEGLIKVERMPATDPGRTRLLGIRTSVALRFLQYIEETKGAVV